MSKKTEEHNMQVLLGSEVEGGHNISDTDVKVSVNNFGEVEDVLCAINKLKIKYPYTKFSVEVNMN